MERNDVQFSSGAPSASSHKRLSRFFLVMALAVATTLLGACSDDSSSSGGTSATSSPSGSSSTLTVADKNAFSTAMTSFVDLQPKVMEQIATGQASGEWAAAESNAAPLIAQMNDNIKTMQSQSAKMPANAKSVATGIVSNATSWATAASAVISSGKSGNAEAVQASLNEIATLSADIAAKAAQWDAVPVG